MDLRIPHEQHEPPPSLDLKARSVRAWLDRLPLARSLEVGAEILDRLQVLNRSKVAGGDRQALLEAFQPVVNTLLDDYEATMANAATPLAATVVESVRLHRALAAELSMGYRILITEAAGKMFGFGMRRQVPAFIRLALSASARVLRASWLSYHAEPEHTWLDLHRLFTIASRTGSAEAATAGEPSPREMYLDCLLIALADPYHMSAADHRRLPDVLKRHRASAKLLPEYPDTITGSHFFLAPERDARPMPLGVADQRTSIVNIVDATALVDRLRAHHQALLNGEMPSSMTPYEADAQASLLDYLINAWGGNEGRLETREADGSLAVAHFGVEEIATALGPHPAAASPDWEIANQSLGGLQLRHRGGQAPRRLAVGEAVSVHAVDGNFTPVGLVRWVRRSRDGTWSCGMQILGPSATAASLLSTTPTGEPTQAPGLVLERESLLAPPTLLTSRGTHAEAREFAVCQRNTTLRVRAGPLLEQNRLIEVFETDDS